MFLAISLDRYKKGNQQIRKSVTESQHLVTSLSHSLTPTNHRTTSPTSIMLAIRSLSLLSLLLVLVVSAHAAPRRQKEYKADLSSWTSSLRIKDRSAIEEQLSYLGSLVEEAVDRDEQLFRLIVPLVKANHSLSSSAAPGQQEGVDTSQIASLVRSLPAKVIELNAFGPLATAIKWLNQRLSPTASAPVSPDGMKHLANIKDLLVQQVTALRGVEAGVSSASAQVALDDGTGKPVDVRQLMQLLANHANGWRSIGGGSSSSSRDPPLLQIPRLIRFFAHDWNNHATHAH